ncbi:MAG TPA: hypothetical protein PLY93_03915, partial [Turneriella sp.]|nr:hypothetical protein [Turneriella sp.]
MKIPQRIDTFESHELAFVPDRLKVLFREILSWEQDMGGVYKAASSIVEEWLQKTRANAILDLCSGAGGPGVSLVRALRQKTQRAVQIKLTDLYPATNAYERLATQHGHFISYETHSFDAANSHRDAVFRVRTLLSAFHHFSPAFAQKILEDAATYSDGICIMDPFQRDLWHLLTVAVGTTLGTQPYPLLKEQSPFAFAMCNLTPVIPAMYFWDSVASVLRGYTEDELIALTRTPRCAAFEWHTGTW